MPANDQPELKPCPFCGSHEVFVGGKAPFDYFVNCADCLASTNILAPGQMEKEDAVAAWNRRA